jgi:arabinose-5-phosphate isomerase
MKEMIMTITQVGLGIAVVLDRGVINGVITDGDLRGTLFNYNSFDGLTAAKVMIANPLTINETEMFADVENIMFKANVPSLLVVSEKSALCGVLKLQDADRLVWWDKSLKVQFRASYMPVF